MVFFDTRMGYYKLWELKKKFSEEEKKEKKKKVLKKVYISRGGGQG